MLDISRRSEGDFNSHAMRCDAMPESIRFEDQLLRRESCRNTGRWREREGIWRGGGGGEDRIQRCRMAFRSAEGNSIRQPRGLSESKRVEDAVVVSLFPRCALCWYCFTKLDDKVFCTEDGCGVSHDGRLGPRALPESRDKKETPKLLVEVDLPISVGPSFLPLLAADACSPEAVGPLLPSPPELLAQPGAMKSMETDRRNGSSFIFTPGAPPSSAAGTSDSARSLSVSPQPRSIVTQISDSTSEEEDDPRGANRAGTVSSGAADPPGSSSSSSSSSSPTTAGDRTSAVKVAAREEEESSSPAVAAAGGIAGGAKIGARQRGQLTRERSQVSMQGMWKAWLHLGSRRSIAPSRNSPRQMLQSVPSTRPSPRLYAHTEIAPIVGSSSPVVLMYQTWYGSPSPAPASRSCRRSPSLSGRGGGGGSTAPGVPAPRRRRRRRRRYQRKAT